MVRHAVQLGNPMDGGLGDNKVFPFWFAFVSKPDDTWVPGNDGLIENLASIGPTVPAGKTVRHIIRLSEDHNFMLLWAKYTVYWFNGAGIPDPDMPAGWWDTEHFNDQISIGTPSTRFVSLRVSFLPDAKFLMGEDIPNAQSSQMSTPLTVIQGHKSGYGQVRTPYLLPRKGAILIDIVNSHASKDLTVGGCFYGLKMRV